MTKTSDDVGVPCRGAGDAAPLPWTSRGRYRVLGVHGFGGFGRILRVRDEVLGRDVAIKELIKRDRISETRFAQEIRLTARLQHPGVVPLYDAGRWPNGALFYAMKLIEGRSLKACMAQASTVATRLGLLPHLIAVADTLAYAHGQRVVHRDIKPSNILIGPFGETVVIDWGLAVDVGAAREGGPIVGTPRFMAPERASGATGDERADIYALGAILRELISSRALRTRGRGARAAALHQIADQATHAQPERRYASATEFATALERQLT